MIVTFIVVNDRNEQCYISDYVINVTMPTGRARFINIYTVHIVDVGDRIQLQKHVCSINVQAGPANKTQTNIRYAQHDRCCMQA